MSSTYIVTSTAGSNRDHSNGSREQSFWDQHADFIDRLVDDGFILLGGPLPDEGGAVLVVGADSEDEVRDRLRIDPWYEHQILALQSVRRWEIFINHWPPAGT